MAERKTGSGRTTNTKRNTAGTRSSGSRSSRSTASSRTAGTRSGARGSAAASSRSGRSASGSGSGRGYSSNSNVYRSKRKKMEEEQMHRDITILLVFVGMVFLFLSNFGILGPVGNTFRDVMTGLFGFTAFLMPIFVFACVVYGMMSRSVEAGTNLGCAIAIYSLFGIICELISGDLANTAAYSMSGIWERCSVNHNGGGVTFGSIAYLLYKTLKMPGTILVIITVSVIVFVLLTKESIVDLVMGAAGSAKDTVHRKREEHYENAQRRREYYEDECDEYEDGEEDNNDHFQDNGRARRRGYPERTADNGLVKGIVGDTKLNEEDYAPYGEGYLQSDAYDYSGELPDPEEAYDFYEEHTGSIPDISAELNNTDSYFQGYKEEPVSNLDTLKELLPLKKKHSADSEEKNIPNTASKAEERNDSASKVESIPAAAPRYSVAEKIIKDAQSGTDGIDLSPSSYDPFEEEPVAAQVISDKDRKPIPIHRESNNLHEINLKDFAESSYASLSQGLYPEDEDEEELTQRIIRDGLIALNEGNAGKNVFNAAEGISVSAAVGTAAGAANEIVHSSFVYDNGIREAAVRTPVIAPIRENDSDDELYYDHSSNELTEIALDERADDRIDEIADENDAENAYSEKIDAESEEIKQVFDEPETEDIRPDEAGPVDVDTRPINDEEDREDQEHSAYSYKDESVSVTEISGNDEAGRDYTYDSRSIDRTMQPMESGNTEAVPSKPMAGEHVSQAAMQHAKEAAIHTENSQPQREDNTVRTTIDGVRVVEHKAEQTPMSPAKKKPYVYPPLDLLSPGRPASDADSDEELRHTAEVLETTLHTFGVSCKITDISQGPAVTRYELLPQVGVKVSKVVSLADDIKLALAATDIRIEAPIPGKSAIGIEVPNKVTSLVALHDVLCTNDFRNFKSKLAFGVGKDISGQIVVTDLAKMPHVLIAGATGSGKSVCINTIIMSILYHSTPEEVKLLMIDPKVVELSVYNGIPHLLYPVVTNPQKAAALLNYAVAEMDQRYRMFADCGVRDIKGYNALIAAKAAQGVTEDEDGATLRQMPRLVVIVDELADLMMVAKNDVETAICRLAQLARAAGIHLIIATQRPSVDVITGLIKANMPSRIAFAVTSGTDSRTILDMNGAEKLLGKGDMLFFPQGLPKPARIQGAFVDDDEVSDVVAFIKQNNPSVNDGNEVERKMASLVSGEGAGSGSIDGGSQGPDIDELFVRAGKFIIEKNSASIGLLQRGFRIGFNRAARIMDQLCDAGVVAESEGTKPRKILMTIAEFDSYCQDNDI